MRELKVRAWDGKEFTYMDYGGGRGLGIWECGSFESIELFIGVKDNEGVDIYEGDILSCKNHVIDGSGDYDLVEYPVVQAEDYIGFSCGDMNIMQKQYTELSCKVVGNIHEGKK